MGLGFPKDTFSLHQLYSIKWDADFEQCLGKDLEAKVLSQHFVKN